MNRKKQTPSRGKPVETEPSRNMAWGESAVAARRRDFSVPDDSSETVRLDVMPDAYAEMLAHAKEFLDQEVCGVLVGELCEDDRGQWVHAQAAIRGTSAKQGGAHVTYTQETWEKIYETKDREYPKLSIVGWYHTHPGFGVEFSEMDLFVQRNFFPGNLQFALVMDPLNGEEAICVNTPRGIEHLAHFWVDGRRRTCKVPQSAQPSSATTVESGLLERKLADVEARLNHLLQSSEEDRARNHRFLTGIGLLVGFAAVLWICSTVLNSVFRPIPIPPPMNNWVPVAVKIDGKEVMLGVGIHHWEVPPELNAALVELERQRAAYQLVERTPAAKDEKTQPGWNRYLPFVLLGLVCVLLAAAVIKPAVRLVRGRRRVQKQQAKP